MLYGFCQGDEFVYRKLIWDDDIIAGLIRTEQDFWVGNVMAGVMPDPDWSERARRACADKGLKFCVNNPIRVVSLDNAERKKMLTMAELKELSDDEVLEILSARYEMSPRQQELVKTLMQEVFA